MTRYRVSMQEIVFYSIYVEADNEQQAAIKAEERFDAGDYIHDGQDDRRITAVEEMT